MDSFSYTNLFDTKGIEYLVIIGFLILIIPFWLLLDKPVKIREKLASAGGLVLNALKIPMGLFYSKNHTWTHLELSGNARIGLDDLLLHITGEVEVNKLINSGEKVNKGDVIAEIRQEGKHLRISSPLSGEIEEVNFSLLENPTLMNSDPYGKGWICKIRPEHWVKETHSCYLAENAIEWTRREMERFKDFIAQSLQKYSPEAGMVILQEGGEIADHPLSEMPDEIWRDFQESFLNP